VPYIPREDRDQLDSLIDELARRLDERAARTPGDLAAAGLLNYACTRLALSVVKLRFGQIRYGVIALVSGVLHNVADELYRRLAQPYEDRQIARNGDVDLYEELANAIGRP
jgi:Domain of unknown function (DUF6899)